MKLHPLLQRLLWPASLLYQGVVRLRAWCYRQDIFKQRRLSSCVISVGNLTVGGTGKTPMVMWIAQRLLGEGKCVGILSRGYRSSAGKSDEVGVISGRLGGQDRICFGVGTDRYVHGRVLEKLGINWFVLDDGFQHLGLARDADIVLIDATEPFDGGYLLPAGRLREPKSALARADIVVVTRSEHAAAIEAVVRRHTQAPIFYAQTQLESIRRVANSKVEAGPTDWLGKKLFAFCAIGNSSAFFNDLRRWAGNVVGQVAFRDHHRYSPRDAERIERKAIAAGAQALMCTEKDVYNLGNVVFDALPLYSCAITLSISGAEEFWQKLIGTAQQKRARVAR